MDSGLKISAVAISAKGKGMNLDNVYVNGRYLAPGSDEPQVCIRKTSNVDFQMYGVCDGENAEDVALKTSPSAMVMQRMQQLQSVLSMDGAISRDKIWSFLCETNGKIREYQEAVGSEGVNSTFAGLFLHKNRGLAVHLGDSRIYVIRGGQIAAQTRDHNYRLLLKEQLAAGQITRNFYETEEKTPQAEALTSFLGMNGLRLLDVNRTRNGNLQGARTLLPEDIVLLCSDGVYKSLSDSQILAMVRDNDIDMNIAADRLTAMALRYGVRGQDNTTVILLRYRGEQEES